MALAGASLTLGACVDEDAPAASSGCPGDAPVLAFDHDTIGPGRAIGAPQVSVLSADGELTMITGSWVASQAAFSPDGDRLVVVKADGDYESAGPESTALWTMRPDGSEPRELTGGDVLDEDPDWSPDGSSVAFVRARLEGDTYRWSIATVPNGGGDVVELFDAGPDMLDEPVWSPDGSRIAFARGVYDDGDTRTTVWTMAPDGSDARPLAPVNHVGAIDWQPDGRTLLVATDWRQGTFVVDTETGSVDLLDGGGDLATWSPDGDHVYFFRSTEEAGRLLWDLVEGRVEGGALVADRTVLAGDDLDGTILADVGLAPGFALAVAPCA